MIRSALFAAAGGLAISCVAISAAPPGETRHVLVGVVDQSGKPLADLHAADFNLEDAGISCEIVGVEAACVSSCRDPGYQQLCQV